MVLDFGSCSVDLPARCHARKKKPAKFSTTVKKLILLCKGVLGLSVCLCSCMSITVGSSLLQYTLQNRHNGKRHLIKDTVTFTFTHYIIRYMNIGSLCVCAYTCQKEYWKYCVLLIILVDTTVWYSIQYSMVMMFAKLSEPNIYYRKLLFIYLFLLQKRYYLACI